MESLDSLKRAIRKLEVIALPGATISRLTKQRCSLEIPGPLPKAVNLTLGSQLILSPRDPAKGTLLFVTTVQELGRPRPKIFLVHQKFVGLLQLWGPAGRGSVAGVCFSTPVVSDQDTPPIDCDVFYVQSLLDGNAIPDFSELATTQMVEDFHVFAERYRRTSFQE